MARKYFAHSGNQCGKWHLLRDHLKGVSELAGQFAESDAIRGEAALAGLIHDLGKYGDAFQQRLRGEASHLDHWSSGAWSAAVDARAVAASLAVQGHHLGLQHLSKDGLRAMDPKQLLEAHPLQLRLTERDPRALTDRFSSDGLSISAVKMPLFEKELVSRVDRMLDVRMVFSCLVDADFLDTEAHFQECGDGKRYRPAGLALEPRKALDSLLSHIQMLQSRSDGRPVVFDARKRLLDDCLAAADENRGLFTLTAPTGSGKTLAMMAFALKHALKWNLRRVVIVLPYLSIIDQSAEVYRHVFAKVFGNDFVLEHHSLAGGGSEMATGDQENAQDETPERRRRLLSENWDAPVIVTTSVQMLESLFSNRPAMCRKLHRLQNSIIIFDEVQTLPANLAVPTLAALSHLASSYGASVVFGTATQPAFSHMDASVRASCSAGWRPREIAASSRVLYENLKRVEYNWHSPDHPITWPELSQQLRREPRVLCIVNIKRHAQTLWKALNDDSAFHLSTTMCPAHRKVVLANVRERLDSGREVRLISTQCVEAGVDLDFPMVYRAFAPLESIIQAAGRCNREGRLDEPGVVNVFMPEDETYPPGAYEQAAKFTIMTLKQIGTAEMKLYDPDFVTGYFARLYDLARPDEAERARKIMDAIKAGSFPDVAKLYRLIPKDGINVVVPYEPLREEYEWLRQRAPFPLTKEWLRRARPLAVQMFRPRKDDSIWEYMVPAGGNTRDLGQEWYVYTFAGHYHDPTGLVPGPSGEFLDA